MKPRWMRNHFSCPECGLAFKTEDELEPHMTKHLSKRGELVEEGFDCPRCKAHFAAEDFYGQNEEKWDRSMEQDDPLYLSKQEFITRLIQAGWSEGKALAEWNEIQMDEEGTP